MRPPRLYFICACRHAKRTTCDQHTMFVPDVETAVEDYYRRIHIPEHIVIALRRQHPQTGDTTQTGNVDGLNNDVLVDLRREFENPCPALKTLSLRRSRGFYKQDGTVR